MKTRERVNNYIASLAPIGGTLMLRTFCTIIIGTCLLQPAFAQQPKTSRPNIIFILTDDLGYGDLGVFYQNLRKQRNDRSKPWTATPNLDRMAAEGAVLQNHYTAAPVCAPSRASLMLGVSQGHANVRDNQFDKALEDNYTMPGTLRTLGYTTACIGKWGLQGLSKDWPAHPLNRGFDYFFGYMRHGDGHEHYPKEAPWRGGAKQVWENRTNLTPQLDKCYTGDLWTAAAKKWIAESTGKNKPFFLYLAYDTPHAVLELMTQAYPSGGGLKGGMQWTGKPGSMINTASGTIDSWTHPDYANATYDDDGNPATAEKPWPETFKRYATAIRRIDDYVGDIRQLLKDLHIDQNTLIVFSSDNGPSMESYLGKDFEENHPDFFESFGPFDGIKRDCWEGGVRMPALAVWNGRIPAGTLVSQPNIAYDWMPTFLEAAGLPAPARTDGVSLLPSLTKKGIQRESQVYVEYFFKGKTPDYPVFDPSHRNRQRSQMQLIRKGDLLGVRYNIQSAKTDFEIYNIKTDPREAHNLAATMPQLQAEFQAKALSMRKPDADAPRPYDSTLVPALTLATGSSGFIWEWYAGHYPWLPATQSILPNSKGKTTTFTSPNVLRDSKGYLILKGYIKAPQDGSYAFRINAPGKAFVRIHDCQVIDADYHMERKTGNLRLQQGLHPVTIWLEKSTTGNMSFSLEWQIANGAWMPMPMEAIFKAQ